MAIDPKHFRRVLGHFPTGVAVITGLDPDGKPAGMAIGSFTSVSLDPPLVAFLPDKSSSSWPKIAPSGKFCVNILASEQEDVCRTFAVKGGDKFASLKWSPAATGSPRLDDVVAWIDCDVEVIHDAGDHLIVIGRVRELDVPNPSLPLIFFQGGYGRFTALSLAAWEGDLQMQLQTADAARPQMEALAEELDVECVAAAVVNDEMVLISNAGNRSQALPTRVGQRIPFLPPLGTAFVAWASDPARAAWLAKAAPDQREALEQTLTEVRSAGYSVGRGASWHREVGSVLAKSRGALTPETTGTVSRMITSLPADYESPTADGSDRTDVQSVSVPVTGPDGTTVLVLTLMVTSKRALAAAVEDHAARLTQAAQAVAQAIAV